MPEPLPERIGRYPITRVLGEGGMGIVFLGRDPGTDRDVAIKTIKANLSEDIKQSIRPRFEREGKAGRLQHPNIVTVYETGEWGDDRPYIAMEYIDGPPLDKLMAELKESVDFQDAYNKINQLDGGQPYLLLLLQLVSQNTSVPNPAFSQPFPGSGAFSQFVAKESAVVALQGSTYAAVPGSPVTPGRGFLQFLNASQAVSNTFFPPSGAPATLNFSLTQESVSGLPPATLDIDGRRLSAPGSPVQFDWHPSGSVQLTSSGGPSNTWPGQWSLFKFAYGGRRSQPNRIEATFEVNGRPSVSASGVPLDYKYDVSGPSAQFLNPGFMKSQLRCPQKVAQ